MRVTSQLLRKRPCQRRTPFARMLCGAPEPPHVIGIRSASLAIPALKRFVGFTIQEVRNRNVRKIVRVRPPAILAAFFLEVRREVVRRVTEGDGL